MSRYYPICLDLQKKECLVIGGGKVAERKILSLMEHEAKVKLVSPKITPQITHLVQEGKINYQEREFQPKDLEGIFLVIAATNNNKVNKIIAQEAQKRGILINVVDKPSDSTFILPAVVKRGDLMISISTGGKSPAFARKMRQDLESQYGPEYRILVDILGNFRENVIQSEPDEKKRKAIFQRLAESIEILKIIRENGRAMAEKRIRELL